MAKPVKSTEGFVYFLYSHESKRLKIGFTLNINKRLAELRNGSPIELELVKFVRGTYGLELVFLALFDKYRLHGEWFQAHPDILRYIRSLSQGAKILPEKLLIK